MDWFTQFEQSVLTFQNEDDRQVAEGIRAQYGATDDELIRMCLLAARHIAPACSRHSIAMALVRCCAATESPLERAMLLALAVAGSEPTSAAADFYIARSGDCVDSLQYLRLPGGEYCDAAFACEDDEPRRTLPESFEYYDRYVVTPQAVVQRFRLDFLVEYHGWVRAVTEPQTSVPLRLQAAVECDGHEFHERTKEQATRDRSRDRALQQDDGMLVCRFTGQEIWRDALGCAREVLKALNDREWKHRREIDALRPRVRFNEGNDDR